MPQEVILNHITEKCDLLENHSTTVDGHINNEQSITNDYMGRALYELLQNAVDRADKSIWIEVDKNSHSLTVSNDGSPFSFVHKSEEFSDFESLCSIHTSNKHPGRSIGNKGVGFKSIWEFCNSVQVRSVDKNLSVQWGFRLRFPFQRRHLQNWVDQKTADAIVKAFEKSNLQQKNRDKAPSFYFPELLDIHDWQHQGAVTSVELENITNDDFTQINTLLDKIIKSPLMFVGDIKSSQDLTLHIRKSSDDACQKKLFVDEKEWIRITPDLSNIKDKLSKEMKKLGFELEDGNGNFRSPNVSMIFPKKKKIDFEGLIHCYLPTEVNIFSPMHIQGDFYLSESRKLIEFEHNVYNKLLLCRVVDELLQSILDNKCGLAGQPYVLQLLSTKGHIGTLLKSRLNGKVLGDIFSSVLRHTPDEHKTTKLYQDLFLQISHFMPTKSHHYYEDHYNFTLKPYFREFCRENLSIVPVKYKVNNNDDMSELVYDSCSLPMPHDKGVESTILFCRQGGDLRFVENLPGVVITPWKISPDNIASAMLKLNIWRKYEQVPLLRAIVRSQKNATNNKKRSKLLKAALKIIDQVKDFGVTKWRFVDKDEIHPSARLLVPVDGETQWAEAQKSFLPDSKGILDRHVDKKLIHRIDHDRCIEVLGSNYRSKLMTIGVWNCVPLIKQKKQKVWEIALSKFPNEEGSLELMDQSYSVWKGAENQDIEGVRHSLASAKWLMVDSGSSNPVAPASVFLGSTASQPLGYFLLSPEGRDDTELDFLRALDIRRLDETTDIKKLVDAAKEIINFSCDSKGQHQLMLKTYRSIVRRINKILLTNAKEDSDPDQYINHLPLLYESGHHDQGVAKDGEEILYAPGSHSEARAKIRNLDTKWWLAKGDIGTLAKQLPQVSIMRLKQEFTIQGSPRPDLDSYEWLEKTYLPKFLAIAAYGNIGGVSNVEEDTIQRRWQGLSVIRAKNARLIESIEKVDGENIFTLKKKGILWEQASLDRSENLKLYIADDFSFESEVDPYFLCQWFAEEIFRQKSLKIYFEKVMLNDDLIEYGVSSSEVNEAKLLIREWFSQNDLDQLLAELSQSSGVQVSASNWRNYSHYKNSEYRFDELQSELSPQLRQLIECINPSQKNLDSLSNYLDENRDQITAMPDSLKKPIEEWIELFRKDKNRFMFNFSPEDWVMQVSGMNQYEFAKLEGKLTSLELDLLAEQEANSSPVSGNPLEARIEIVDRIKDSSNTHLVNVQNDEERIADIENNSKSGKNFETRVAIQAARKANDLDEKKAGRFFSLISTEYKRHGKYDKLPARPPSTEKGWLKILHLGAKWDGAGYDVLDYDSNLDKILLIEAKSTRSNPPRIYFSEPERCEFLRMNSSQFKNDHPNSDWRLYLGTKDEYVDITTDFIKKIVNHNELFHRKMFSNPSPKDWVLQVRNVKKSNGGV